MSGAPLHDSAARTAPATRVPSAWAPGLPVPRAMIHARLSFSQGNRFYFWTTSEFPIPRADIETHSANMHLIAADEQVARQIKSARAGQLVSLAGYLVNVRAADGWTLETSLVRNDTGPGSCEVIWVESFE